MEFKGAAPEEGRDNSVKSVQIKVARQDCVEFFTGARFPSGIS
jgi:hypothetical protein